MRLKMAIRFLNWSLWLIILLRCVGGDFQVTSEFESFENQFQRVVEPTSPGICYAWITRWQRRSFAFSSHGMVFFMSHARITRWQRSLFAFSSHGMFFFMTPNKGLLLRTRKRKWFKSRISYYSNTTASFNSMVISLLVSGDVHPHPGPEVSSQNSAFQQVKLRVECCVRDIDEWMIRNYLKLNQDKTDLVVISSRFHPMPDIGHITVGSECIAPRDSVCNLGVQFDSIFSFEEHIKNICKSSFYHLRNIAKIRKYLSQDTCKILVHAFISSKIDHCNSLLHGLPKYLLARLQAVQNAAARVVTLTPRHVHITPILINLHWLPVEFRITFKVLLLVYKALHGLAPSYISDLLNFKTYSRSLRSSCKEYLVVPRSRLKTYGDRAFSIAGPKLWNDLPLEIRKCASVATFKQSLKTFLFKLAYRL